MLSHLNENTIHPLKEHVRPKFSWSEYFILVLIDRSNLNMCLEETWSKICHSKSN